MKPYRELVRQVLQKRPDDADLKLMADWLLDCLEFVPDDPADMEEDGWDELMIESACRIHGVKVPDHIRELVDGN